MSEHIAVSNSLADVQAACAAAKEDGAIVTIPPGNVHWSDHLEWDIPPNARFRSAGLTIIDDYKSDNSLINFNTHKDGFFAWHGIQTAGGMAGDNAKYSGVIQIGGHTKDLRMYNWHSNHWTYSPLLPHAHIRFSNHVCGVIFNCIFDLHSVGNGIQVHYDSYGGAPRDDGSTSWASPTLPGSRDALYIERSVFNGNSRYSCINDCLAGGKMVIRFNLLNRACFQTHPTRTGIPRGSRWIEAYGNKMIATDEQNPIYTWFYHDAGGAIVFLNEAKTGYTKFHLMRASRRASDGQSFHDEVPPPAGWGWAGTTQPYADGTPNTGSNWDGNQEPATGYPNVDQVGRGRGDKLEGEHPTKRNATTNCDYSKPGAWPRQDLEPVYNFLNDWAPVPGYAGDFIEVGDTIKEGRDYHRQRSSLDPSLGGVIVGTRAQMEATTSAKEGSAFWLNEGNWNRGDDPNYPKEKQGQLWIRKGGVWVKGYEPYTFPHPGAVAEESGGAPLPPDPTPIPPDPIPAPPNTPPKIAVRFETTSGVVLDPAVPITLKNVKIKVATADDVGPVVNKLFLNNNEVHSTEDYTFTYSWNTAPYKGKTVAVRVASRDADGAETTETISVIIKK